jgi:hypothetical protein
MKIQFVTDTGRVAQLAALIPSFPPQQCDGYPNQWQVTLNFSSAYVGFGSEQTTVFGIKAADGVGPLIIPNRLIGCVWVDKKV